MLVIHSMVDGDEAVFPQSGHNSLANRGVGGWVGTRNLEISFVVLYFGLVPWPFFPRWGWRILGLPHLPSVEAPFEFE